MTTIHNNNDGIIEPFINRLLLKQCGLIQRVKIDMKSQGNRIILAGGSGSGKTTAAKLLLAKTCRHLSDSRLTILDYKHIDFVFCEGGKNYYFFEDVDKGFIAFYEMFEYRLKHGLKASDPWEIIYMDEHQNYLLSLPSTVKEKEAGGRLLDQKTFLSMFSRLMGLSRALKIHVILSVQKPMAELFGNQRESANIKIGLGSLSPQSIQILFDEYKDRCSPQPCGSGYFVKDEVNFTNILVSYPWAYEELIQKDIFDAVNR